MRNHRHRKKHRKNFPVDSEPHAPRGYDQSSTASGAVMRPDADRALGAFSTDGRRTCATVVDKTVEFDTNALRLSQNEVQIGFIGT